MSVPDHLHRSYGYILSKDFNYSYKKTGWTYSKLCTKKTKTLIIKANK